MASTKPCRAPALPSPIDPDIADAVENWFFFMPWRWGRWSALDDPFPVEGDVKPQYDYAGADSVILGSVLAATEESPGEKIIHEGRHYVVYRGMGSLAAMTSGKGSRERYSQTSSNPDDLVPQGIEGIVPLAGSVKKIMTQFCGGLRSSLGYCGSRTVAELKRQGQLYRVTNAGVREAHPHDVKIIKEAPNYRS